MLAWLYGAMVACRPEAYEVSRRISVGWLVVKCCGQFIVVLLYQQRQQQRCSFLEEVVLSSSVLSIEPRGVLSGDGGGVHTFLTVLSNLFK